MFRASEKVDMPAPGDLRPARYASETHDLAWNFLYAPLIATVGYIADHLNVMQFLSIRHYLALVFMTLVGLLTVLTLWP